MNLTMKRQFEFVVPGNCVPWARAGGGKGVHRFTPLKQRNYMGALRLFCQTAMCAAGRTEPLEGPVRMVAEFVYAFPKSWSKKKRDALGIKYKDTKPDLDNLEKIVGDALNGVAWIDDSQIADKGGSRKVYGDMPGLRVTIEALTE
jgi:Holliday junction resolvase RusA-like endonuclease